MSPNVCGLGPPHADCHHQQQGRLHTLHTTPHISADNHSVNTSTSTITATPTLPTGCTLHHHYKLSYRQFTKHGNVSLLPGLCTHHGQRCVCVYTSYNACMIGLRTNLAGVMGNPIPRKEGAPFQYCLTPLYICTWTYPHHSPVIVRYTNKYNTLHINARSPGASHSPVC